MTTFFVLTVLLAVVSVAMILLILVQRAQGGGLAGAFGGAGGGGTDTVFGGRVGDALTWATIVAFGVYITLAVVVNKVDIDGPVAATTPDVIDGTTEGLGETSDDGTDGLSIPVDGSPDGSTDGASTIEIPAVPVPSSTTRPAGG